MSKHHYDELMAILDEVLDGHDVKTLNIQAITDTGIVAIECAVTEKRPLMPRYPDIHGEVTIH